MIELHCRRMQDMQVPVRSRYRYGISLFGNPKVNIDLCSTQHLLEARTKAVSKIPEDLFVSSQGKGFWGER